MATEAEKQAIERKLNECIDKIDYVYLGSKMKDTLWYVFANYLQDEDLFPAKTLQGLYPSDFVTEKILVDYMTSGLKFDALPIKKSKKAVQSGGLADLFGDLQEVYDEYDKLFDTSIIIKEGDVSDGD